MAPRCRCVPPRKPTPVREPGNAGRSAVGADIERGSAATHFQQTASQPFYNPMGLVLFTAYVLGAASQVAGVPAPVWLPTLTGAAIGGWFAALSRWCTVRLWRCPHRPLTVVITGGSKGLGKALAREFLLQGDSVVITGRQSAAVAETVSQLKSEAGEGTSIFGVVCDLCDPISLQAAADEAKALLGGVDVWLNNAGYSGSFKSFQDLSEDQIRQVVMTNLAGGLLATKAAMRLMLAQDRMGHIFSVDGAGADGLPTPQYAAYGATKCALPQLQASLLQEMEGAGVGFHIVSPGMMITDLLLEGATLQNKQIFNILCEHPETVAAFLVPRMKSFVARGQSSSYTKYLTPLGAIGRFLTAPVRVDRFFARDGTVLYLPEHERILGKHAKLTARQSARARQRTQALSIAYSLSLALSILILVVDATFLGS